jgi:hypothetical protein
MQKRVNFSGQNRTIISRRLKLSDCEILKIKIIQLKFRGQIA